MKNLALAVLLSFLPYTAWATSYFLAPAQGGGSDSNNGLTNSTPWLTPNHALSCGDTITAAASLSYSAANFGQGRWGTVTCPGGNNVAWLICATFDACKISATGSGSEPAMLVSASFWGVQGWEAAGSGTYQGCFSAQPPGNGSNIHHIIFANDVANVCQAGGFAFYSNGNAGVDYIVVVGSIAYNSSLGSTTCYSGISIYQPVQFDSQPGTHIYVGGNFSFGNNDPSSCSSPPTDGEGIIFDTFDGIGSGLAYPYTAQAVADNNILVSNGGRGFEVFNNSSGSTHAAIYVRHNTMWGNNGDANQRGTFCGEFLINKALNVRAYFNIASTNATDGCGANPLYSYFVGNGDGTDTVYSNLGYAVSGTYSSSSNSTGFSFGPNNLFGTNPNFLNASAPGSPNCGATTSVPNCMAAIIANFTPQSAAAAPYGYQKPGTAQTYDPLFPQWLCNVNLPAGLVTMGCLPASALPATVTITGVTVQ